MSGMLLKPADGASWIMLPDGTTWKPDGVPVKRAVPRVCIVPKTFAFSSGQEAIDIAEAAGLVLDPWQQLCLILGLGETTQSKWAAFTVALIVARQNGKGSILEALELFWLFGSGEQLIGHSAHEYKTAMEAFRRVLALIENNDWLRKKVKKVINTNGEEGIELLNGQRLRFMARSKGAGRGFTFHKLVWDEGYALTGEQQDAQLPTMSAVDNPQIWITSSPPLSSDTGQVLFRTKRLADALGDELVFLDYGAAGSLDQLELIDLDDPEVWKMTNPSETHAGTGHGVSLEYMAKERSAMGDVGFARERLCIWPPDLTAGFTVISKEQWQAMLDPHSGRLPGRELTGVPVISIDVSPRTQGAITASIGLAAWREDGNKHIELIKNAGGTRWVVDAAIKIMSDTGARLVIDPGSPAGSLLADLRTAVRTAQIPEDRIITMSSRDVAASFGMIYDAATEVGAGTVFHMGQPELALAIGGAMKRKVGESGHAWDRLNASVDITGLVAVTHALGGLAEIGVPVEEEPLVMWA